MNFIRSILPTVLISGMGTGAWGCRPSPISAPPLQTPQHSASEIETVKQLPETGEPDNIMANEQMCRRVLHALEQGDFQPQHLDTTRGLDGWAESPYGPYFWGSTEFAAVRLAPIAGFAGNYAFQEGHRIIEVTSNEKRIPCDELVLSAAANAQIAPHIDTCIKQFVELYKQHRDHAEFISAGDAENSHPFDWLLRKLGTTGMADQLWQDPDMKPRPGEKLNNYYQRVKRANESLLDVMKRRFRAVGIEYHLAWVNDWQRFDNFLVIYKHEEDRKAGLPPVLLVMLPALLPGGDDVGFEEMWVHNFNEDTGRYYIPR